MKTKIEICTTLVDIEELVAKLDELNRHAFRLEGTQALELIGGVRLHHI